MSKVEFSKMREAMVASQLRTNGVNDPRVLQAIEGVARERFVPPARAALAYVDVSVPLGGDRALNAPLATARLIMEAGLKAGDAVLLIGAATGYLAAVLAALDCTVTAVESDTALADQAKANLAGQANVSIVTGPLEAGWADAAPYDAIIVDGSMDVVPDALWDQLREGGVFTGAVRRGHVTHLARGVKAGTAHTLLPFIEAEATVLPGFSAKREFAF